MDNNKILNMLKDEVLAKADAETIAKLKNCKSPQEAIKLLESISIDLDDDTLAAIAAGTGNDDKEPVGIEWCGDLYCQELIPPHY